MTPEVQTPRMDEIVAKEGIQHHRFYAYHMCSPTRSSIQSGRLPINVNTENAGPTIYNPKVGGGIGAGIPRNMTCMAQKLKKAGYHTAIVGKVRYLVEKK